MREGGKQKIAAVVAWRFEECNKVTIQDGGMEGQRIPEEVIETVVAGVEGGDGTQRLGLQPLCELDRQRNLRYAGMEQRIHGIPKIGPWLATDCYCRFI